MYLAFILYVFCMYLDVIRGPTCNGRRRPPPSSANRQPPANDPTDELADVCG